MKLSSASPEMQALLSDHRRNPELKHLNGKPTLSFLFLLLLLLHLPIISSSSLLVSVPLGFQISPTDTLTWVSQDGAFALGFIPSRESNDGFLAGIWHNLAGDRIPVWTVGGGVRIGNNSTLILSHDGSLVLLDGCRSPNTHLPVWSSNTVNAGVHTATLLKSGNLVLMGLGGEIVWESFESPTDTLLPGQPLRFPRSLRAAASTNSVASYYSLVVRSSGDIELVWEDNVTYWGSFMSLNLAAKEARLEPSGLLGLFDSRGGMGWFRLSKDFRDPLVEFRRLRIDADGNLRMYSWNNVSSSWRVGWQAVQNQCDVFGSCGLYSVCSYNSSATVCQCLSQELVSQGCQKMADLGNCQSGISMSILNQTSLYSLYPPHDVDVMLSLDACREYCLNDSSCFAATAKNDGSGICTIKRTDFISGYSYPSVSAVSFLKVCLVPEAVSAEAAYFHDMSRRPLAEQSGTRMDGRHKIFMAGVAALLLVTAFIFLAVEMIVFWFIVHRRRQLNARKRTPFGKDAQLNLHYSALVRLSYDEVKELTKNFGSKLGPSVYKGALPNKLLVAVKMLNDVLVSDKDFQMAILTLASTHHRNLVTLKGFCCERGQKLLLYEYISNASLDQWLFSRKQNQVRDNWHQRLAIAIGIARALAYLHLECKQCIAHGNLKLENILLDEYLVAKVTDFGLQSLLQKDIASTSETPPERDVCMFGKILLQIVAGKEVSIESKLCDSAYQMLEKGAFRDFVDIHLEGESEVEAVQRVMRLALWCMQAKPSLRPSICEVVMVLEGALSLEMPPSSVKAHQTNC